MEDKNTENKFFDLLEKSIIEISSVDGEKNYYPPFFIKLYKNKYSSLDKESPIVFSDEEALKTRKNKVKYKCGCGGVYKIHLSKFLKKKILTCVNCKETEEKRKNHSKTLLDRNRVRKVKLIKTYSLDSHIELSVQSFKNESKEFLERFYDKNVTKDEFDFLKNKIVAIDGFIVENKKLEFLPPLTITNQAKYSQYVLIDGKKVLLQNVTFKCDCCNEKFNTTRRIKTRTGQYKILCSSCSFCNNIFKVRKYTTIFNDEINYQSGPELLFVKQCEDLGIKILNGPKIDYLFKNKKRKYHVDFFLKELGILVEIKANHIWHRNQINSGKWKAKQTAAEKFCKQNNITYKLFFQEDIEQFFASIKI